ncbi:MAG: hypothetical protein MUC90_01155 [Thermoplasmata archaeon]|nr:hypothetical protein [Thermoplasmata archaeon]
MEEDRPLSDMPREATRIVDRARDRGVQLRLMGGLAVRMHCSNPDFCERKYSDIDLIGLSSQGEMIEAVFRDLGYEPDKEFNVLHGTQRLKYEDHFNNRHAEVFLDKFRMDQTLDFRGRLEIHPYTISLSDLFITKIQVVKMDEKDFHDLFSLLRENKIGVDDREGVINARYVAQMCAHDWGLYHTVLRNLDRLTEFYDHFKLDQRERDSMDRKIWIIRLMIIEEPKGPIWKARDRVGERLPYFDEVEREGGED